LKVETTKETKTNINSENLVDIESSSQIKITSIGQVEKINSTEGMSENRLYFSRNFKLGRGKQTSSANQGDKDTGCGRTPSINKDMLATHIKATLED
jgi:hypothetical protein